MAVAGVNSKPNFQGERSVLTAMKLLEAVEYFNTIHGSNHNWALRIGIHSGPVVAGIVGNQKIAFDVWGDTVNISSRLEGVSSSKGIAISEKLNESINGSFVTKKLGEKELHNWGKMNVFEVESLKDINDDLKALYNEMSISSLFDESRKVHDSLLNQLFDLKYGA